MGRSLLLLAVLLASHAQAAPPGFWDRWGDGKGELSRYRLTQQRYGQTRVGTAVAIYVTEDFSFSARVKADPGKHPPEDVFPVMKLNVVEAFQTGIYDYHLMTSAWARVEAGHGMPAGAPVKLSFSSQEWCGQVSENWWFHPDGSAQVQRHSYFDGEGDTATTASPAILQDMLFLTVRGLAAGTPARGSSVSMDVVPRLKISRLTHQPAVPVKASLARSTAAEKLVVPAGTFLVERFTLEAQGKTLATYWVEEAAPWRLIAWEVVGQEKAELTGTMRDAYWQHHGNGDETLLKSLGVENP